MNLRILIVGACLGCGSATVIACPDVIGGPDPNDVVIEGTVLGVMGDHGTESWLGDCVVTPL